MEWRMKWDLQLERWRLVIFKTAFKRSERDIISNHPFHSSLMLIIRKIRTRAHATRERRHIITIPSILHKKTTPIQPSTTLISNQLQTLYSLKTRRKGLGFGRAVRRRIRSAGRWKRGNEPHRNPFSFLENQTRSSQFSVEPYRISASCSPLSLTWPFLSSAPPLLLSSALWEWLLPSSSPVCSLECIRNSLDLGSAYGTAKAGVGVCSMGVFRPDAVMRNMLPVIMAGILGIYGLIASIIMVYSSSRSRFI